MQSDSGCWAQFLEPPSKSPLGRKVQVKHLPVLPLLGRKAQVKHLRVTAWSKQADGKTLNLRPPLGRKAQVYIWYVFLHKRFENTAQHKISWFCPTFDGSCDLMEKRTTVNQYGT